MSDEVAEGQTDIFGQLAMCSEDADPIEDLTGDPCAEPWSSQTETASETAGSADATQ